MKINKHIYADISEKVVESQNISYLNSYQTFFAYKVNLITEYNIILFGKTFHKIKTKEIPFLFKTLDMAKEFCEINPKYKKVCIQNNEEDYYSVKFYTYQLVVNRKIIGYIWWNDKTVSFNNGHHMEFKFNSIKFNSNSIIDGFVKNIIIQSWINTNYLSDIKYYGFINKLTDLVKPIVDNEKHWRFELIENK